MLVFYRLVIAKFYYENESDEDFKKNLKSLGLVVPVPRNWSGTDKVSYSFITIQPGILQWLCYTNNTKTVH